VLRSRDGRCLRRGKGGSELERAVRQLGLRGVFVPSAKGDLLPDAEEARPTLAAAAALGVPVFLHPVEDPQLFDRFKGFRGLGMRLTRGTINSAALFAILESGMFEELPGLRVVVTALALGGLLLAGTVGDGAKLHSGTPPDARRHIYVDTTGAHAAVIRSAVTLLGADHVLMGTDWPVVVENAIGSRLQAAMIAVGLSDREQTMIGGVNALRLIGIV
jgi:aminocarboxymuconate-semialdehyde decarboxylase